MPESKITSKGRVTIPLEVRRKLALRKGDRVEFTQEGDDTIIRRAPDPENPFERYKGALKAFSGDLRVINRRLADLRDAETAKSENGCSFKFFPSLGYASGFPELKLV